MTETSTRFYHISVKWTAGQPLLPFADLVASGLATDDEWQWGTRGDDDDSELVCFFESLSEAEDLDGMLTDSDPNSKLLAVDVPDSKTMVVNSEGYFCIVGAVPAEWITVLDWSEALASLNQDEDDGEDERSQR